MVAMSPKICHDTALPEPTVNDLESAKLLNALDFL